QRGRKKAFGSPHFFGYALNYPKAALRLNGKRVVSFSSRLHPSSSELDARAISAQHWPFLNDARTVIDVNRFVEGMRSQRHAGPSSVLMRRQHGSIHKDL